jgi:hypothetical protein
MKTIFSVLTALALLTGGATADYVLTMEIKHMDSDPPRVEEGQILMTKDMLKTSDPEHSATMIFSSKEQAVYIIEDEKKQYMVMDKESMAKAGGAMAEAMKQAEEALAALPEDQRKMAEKMMKQQMGQAMSSPGAAEAPEQKIRKTDEKKTIDGKPCQRYDLLEDGAKTAEIWATDWSNVDMGKGDFAVFVEFGRFMREMMASIPFGQGNKSMGFLQVFDEIDGCPIHVRNFENETVSMESTVKSIEKTSLDASSFAVPDGYAKQDPFAGMQ